MSTWKEFNIQWLPVKDNDDYIKLKTGSSEYSHRTFNQLANKVRKQKPNDLKSNTQILEDLLREMNSICGSFVDTFFREKSPNVFLTNKFFSLGLTYTDRKCHIISNMISNAPLYVYECNQKEVHFYIDRCNAQLVLINHEAIRNHFHFHEVTLNTNYVAPMETVYILFTATPSYFLAESVVSPFDITMTDTKMFKSSKFSNASTQTYVQNNDDHSGVAEAIGNVTDQPSGSIVIGNSSEIVKSINRKGERPCSLKDEDFATFLEDRNRRMFKALEHEKIKLFQLLENTDNKIQSIRDEKNEIEHLHKIMDQKIRYMQEKLAEKDREINVIKGDKEREIFNLKKELEIQSKNSLDKLEQKTNEILELESQNVKDQEFIQELSEVINALERENSEMKQKASHITKIIKSLNIE